MKEREYFVAHEFSKGKLHDLRTAIESAFRGTGLKARYPERNLESKTLFETITQDILNTEFGIYDICSKKSNLLVNPNVILELGIAIGAKKDSYILVEKERVDEIIKQVSDLAGIIRIEYSAQPDLKEQIKQKIIPRYAIPEEFRLFWLPFIEEGGTTIVGVQTQNLGLNMIRNVIGEYDDIATSNLRSFLFSVAKSSVVKSQKLSVEHLPMPLKVKTKKLKKYVSSIRDFLKTTDRNYVLIGTPVVNPATEIVMSEIFGVEPFSHQIKARSNCRYVINDPRRRAESAFYVKNKNKAAGIWDTQTDQLLSPFIRGQESCGIIIKAKLWDKNFIILAGYNGIATVGAVEILTNHREEVDVINRKIVENESKKGFLYRTQFEISKEDNKPFVHRLKNASIVREVS